MKKISALFTAFLLMSSFTACNGTRSLTSETSKSTGATLEVKLSNSCKSAPMSLDEDWKYAHMYPCGDDILLYYQEETENHYGLYHPSDGSFSEAEPTQEAYFINAVWYNGQIEILSSHFEENIYTKSVYDTDMNLIRAEDVTEAFKDTGVTDWVKTSDGTEYIASESGIYIRKPDGKAVCLKENCTFPALTIGKNDTVCYTEAGTTPFLIHPETMTCERINIEGLPKSNWNNGKYFDGQNQYDLTFTDETEFYGINISENSKEKLINWNDSDMNPATDCILLPEHQYAVRTISFTDFSHQLCILTPRTQEELDSMKLISIASSYQFRQEFKEMVHAFNRQSEDCRLVLHEYDTVHVDKGSEALTNDLLSGMVPDILVLDYLDYMPLSNKGLFEDLRPYMDNDPDFHQEEYFIHLFDALSYKGRMERIAFQFTVSTMIAKTEHLDGRTKLTASEALALDLPEGMALLHDALGNKNTLMEFVNEVNHFVDYENAVCHFDSQEFIDLLTVIGTVQEKQIPQDYYAYIENRALLKPVQLFSLTDYHAQKQIYFGNADITLTGCLSDDEGNGSVFLPQTCVAVSSVSQYKQQAWNFIKFCMQEENFPINALNVNSLHSFPVNRAATKALLYAQTEKRENSTGFYYFDGENIEIGTPTQQEAEELFSFFDNIRSAQLKDSHIITIVQEEAGKYLSGDCTPESAADSIQQRVEIYLAEQN